MADINLFPVAAGTDIVLRDSASLSTGGDDIIPSFTGTLTAAATSNSITVDWSGTTSADNVAVARREYRIGSSGAYIPATAAEESSKQHIFTGLDPGTGYMFSVRCVDTSGNVSEPLTIGKSTAAAPPAGGGATNYIRATLATHGGVLHLNLATLCWALFSKLTPDQFGAPVAKGKHTMPPGSADVVIAVPAATVPAGWYFLVLSDEDGTTALAAPILVGP